MLSGNRG